MSLNRRYTFVDTFTLLLVLAAATARAQTKLLRFPDIHGDRVTFCYAGDNWTAPASGGTATRLTAHPGQEVFPKFSPDGKGIAFTGQYDGDEQVYVVPATGGVPKQLTYKPVTAGRKEVARTRESKDKDEESIAIPPLIAQVGRKGLTAAQRWFYTDVLKPDLKGQANVPQYTHFIVVANHASHLDMGLVKTVLGYQCKKLVALAAADCFFDNKVKRTFFNNFTNLVPMERKGSLRKSLEWAFHRLPRRAPSALRAVENP